MIKNAALAFCASSLEPSLKWKTLASLFVLLWLSIHSISVILAFAAAKMEVDHYYITLRLARLKMLSSESEY